MSLKFSITDLLYSHTTPTISASDSGIKDEKRDPDSKSRQEFMAIPVTFPKRLDFVSGAPDNNSPTQPSPDMQQWMAVSNLVQ